MKLISQVIVVCFLFCFSLVNASIETKEINYSVNDTEYMGYLAYPEQIDAKLPVVLVVHEWWGHNAYARKRAEMLADLGYVAFALDMYGAGKVADHPDDAKKFMQEALSESNAISLRFEEAMRVVKKLEFVDPDNIAAIGYCFGGAVVLNMARAGKPLNGVVSFHGALATKQPAVKGNVSARVLVLHGGNDAFIPEEQVAAFEDEMQQAEVDYELVTYDGVEHSFTNPDADRFADEHSMPLSYDEEADEDSWNRMQVFLKEVFN